MGEALGQGRPEVREITAHSLKLTKRDLAVERERSGKAVSQRSDRGSRADLPVALQIHVHELRERLDLVGLQASAQGGSITSRK